VARSERDRKQTSRVLGVLFAALPFALVQGVFASLLGDGVKRRACDVEDSGGYLVLLAAVAFGAVVLAVLLALPRPRWAAGVLGFAGLASLVFAAAGGWGASNCALGI
jgi:hypothetical protein